MKCHVRLLPWKEPYCLLMQPKGCRRRLCPIYIKLLSKGWKLFRLLTRLICPMPMWKKPNRKSSMCSAANMRKFWKLPARPVSAYQKFLKLSWKKFRHQAAIWKNRCARSFSIPNMTPTKACSLMCVLSMVRLRGMWKLK